MTLFYIDCFEILIVGDFVSSVTVEVGGVAIGRNKNTAANDIRLNNRNVGEKNRP